MNMVMHYIFPIIILVIFFYSVINFFRKKDSWFIYPAKIGLIGSVVLVFVFLGYNFLIYKTTLPPLQMECWLWVSCYLYSKPFNLPILIILPGLVSLISSILSRQSIFFSGLISGLLSLSILLIIFAVASLIWMIGNYGSSPWDENTPLAFFATPLLYYLSFVFHLFIVTSIFIGASFGSYIKMLYSKFKR